MQDNNHYTFDRVMRITFTGGLLCGLVWLLGYLSDVLIPFAVAVIVAYFINPLVLLIQKWIKNRTASVFAGLILIAGLAVLLGVIMVPMMISETKHMGHVISEVANNSALAERAAELLPPDLWQALQDYAAKKEVQDFFKTDNFWKIAETAARKIMPGVWGLITGTANLIIGLTGLSVIGLYLVFLLIDYQKVSDGWKDLLPQTYKAPIVTFMHEFETAMSRYFRAQAAVAAIVGALFAMGFWIIKLPMGLLLGIFIGILNMVPYLQIVGLIPALLLALVFSLETGTGFFVVIAQIGLIFALIQIIQDTLLVPKIMGKVTGLNPAVMLLSLSVWGKLLGIFGLLIALPMTCLLLAYYRGIITPAEKNLVSETQHIE